MKIHASGLTKINSYSTLIPLYFNRRFLVSKACQFTAVVLFNEMKRLNSHDNNRLAFNDRGITKSVRSAIREMEDNRKSDHSFRLET